MTVLHYTGYAREEGGIVSVIRALHDSGKFRVLHGVSEDFTARETGGPELWRGPAIAAETINLATLWRAWVVAQAVRVWLQAEPGRVFHGHSRAGMLVGLWLHRFGERRVMVSVHCYGRQRWLYRWAARQLGPRLFWLTPAMRRHYRLPDAGWEQCIPGGVTENDAPRAAPVPGRLRFGGAGFTIGWKRWDLVVEALALLPPASRAQITFQHIGGPGGDEKGRACLHSLRELTARRGVEGCVTWCGPEPSSRRLLAEIDVLVVPSHDEPYSMILQEALAAGVPVLAADSGGPRDVLDLAVNGRFFRDGDARALANALQEWLSRPPAFDPAAIRRTARRAADVATQWAEIYQGL